MGHFRGVPQIFARDTLFYSKLLITRRRNQLSKQVPQKKMVIGHQDFPLLSKLGQDFSGPLGVQRTKENALPQMACLKEPSNRR